MRDVWLVGCREIVVEIMASINVSTFVNSPHSSPRLSWISQLLRVLLCRPKRKSSFRGIFALYERQQIAKGCTQGRFPSTPDRVDTMPKRLMQQHAAVTLVLAVCCLQCVGGRWRRGPLRCHAALAGPRRAQETLQLAALCQEADRRRKPADGQQSRRVAQRPGTLTGRPRVLFLCALCGPVVLLYRGGPRGVTSHPAWRGSLYFMLLLCV